MLPYYDVCICWTPFYEVYMYRCIVIDMFHIMVRLLGW